MDTTDDASAVAVVEPMMTEDGLVNFPNEEVKVRLNIRKNETFQIKIFILRLR